MTVDFDIFLPNPENKRVRYDWTFPEGTMTEGGQEISTFTGYADENGNVEYPGKLKFRNIGSQRITIQTTFDLDGENRRLEDSYVNVQVGADKEYKTLYYAVLDGNIKAMKIIPDDQIPQGSKNLPFDLGVSSGSMPFNLVYYDDPDGNGWIYTLDAGKQYTYINDEAGTNGDGRINVMSPDGSNVNTMVTNVGQTAFNDPFFGCVDGENMIYSDRNTGLRSTALSARGETEKNSYFVQNDQLGYYSRGIAYGAISTTIYKDSKGTYWWGKCFNGMGIFRFKSTDIIEDYSTAIAPNAIVLGSVPLKAFAIDESRNKLYVWRTKSDGGFYVFNLPADNVPTAIADATSSFKMDADPINTTADEGVYVTQMAVDSETGNVYFGFNSVDANHTTGLKYYDYANDQIVDIPVVTDKMLGIVINDNKTKLF